MAQVRPTNNWTAVPNTWLRDNNLSLKTKGLLCVMNSLPPDWKFTMEGLTSISKEGIDAIRTALKEAEDCGYLTRKYVRNELGHIIDTIYILHETPQQDKQTPISENPMSGTPRLYNKEGINKEEYNYSAGNDLQRDVVVVERMGYNSKGAWKKNKTLYTTPEEADKIESAGESEYPEFSYWPSRASVGQESKEKVMRGYKKTCFKLLYPEPEATTTVGGEKVKVSYDYEEGQ